jgi:uncharacterized membrane protein YoaK (UPF0700 family)
VFIAQAHSFTQQARLAITLAWVAGYTNTIGILACGHVISHVSGTTSDAARWAVAGRFDLAGFLAFLLATFMVGAMLSGLTTEIARRRGRESVYVVPMGIEAALLAAFAVSLEIRRTTGVSSGVPLYALAGMASCAMGLQNATITRISGGVVRTTHVTGVLTDLGLEVVNTAYGLLDRRRAGPGASATPSSALGAEVLPTARHHAPGWRVLLLASIFGSFMLGSGLGASAFTFAPRAAMFPPVLFLLWVILQDLRAPIAEIDESALVSADRGLCLPTALSVFELRHQRSRPGRVHRMPDLQVWADRLPAHVRVVVLDLAGVPQIDEESVAELRTASTKLRTRHRAFLLAGLAPSAIEELRRAGGADLLDPASACPDLELAIARGLALL